MWADVLSDSKSDSACRTFLGGRKASCSFDLRAVNIHIMLYFDIVSFILIFAAAYLITIEMVDHDADIFAILAGMSVFVVFQVLAALFISNVAETFCGVELFEWRFPLMVGIGLLLYGSIQVTKLVAWLTKRAEIKFRIGLLRQNVENFAEAQEREYAVNGETRYYHICGKLGAEEQEALQALSTNYGIAQTAKPSLFDKLMLYLFYRG